MDALEQAIAEALAKAGQSTETVVQTSSATTLKTEAKSGK